MVLLCSVPNNAASAALPDASVPSSQSKFAAHTCSGTDNSTGSVDAAGGGIQARGMELVKESESYLLGVHRTKRRCVCNVCVCVCVDVHVSGFECV